MILSKLADRLALAAAPTFPIDTVRTEDPAAWAAVCRELGVPPDHNFELLGSGAKGSAYSLSPTQAVKFTTDHSEAEALAKIAGKQLKTLVHVTPIKDKAGKEHPGVFSFAFRSPGNLVYCIVQERLEKGVAPEWKNFGELVSFYFDQVCSNKPFHPSAVQQCRDWAEKRQTAHRPVDLIKKDKGEEPKPDGTRVGRIKRGGQAKPARNIYEEVEPDRAFGDWPIDLSKPLKPEMWQWFETLCGELVSNGIEFHDLNGGNIMLRGSDHVVIDLGYSRTEGAGPIRQIQQAGFIRQLCMAAVPMQAMERLAKHAEAPSAKRDEATWSRLLARAGLSIDAESNHVGRGKFGDVFVFPAINRALKLTRDRVEVLAALTLMKHPVPEAYTPYDAFKIAGYRGLYGIWMETLLPADLAWSRWIDIFHEKSASTKFDPAFVSDFFRWEFDELPEAVQRSMPAGLDLWLEHAAEHLTAVGITHGDVHRKNIMRRPSGEHVLIDFGHNSVAPEQPIVEARTR